jgi:hypothetical protein
MNIYADSPDIAKKVIKKHKENKMRRMKTNSVILQVAKLITETDCRDGVENWMVARIDNEHQMSGTQRLRELAKRFYLSDDWNCDIAYEYSHNRYYPTATFKKFCHRYIKEHTK